MATGSATLANWVMQRPAEGMELPGYKANRFASCEFLQNVNAKEGYVFEVNISEYTKET